MIKAIIFDCYGVLDLASISSRNQRLIDFAQELRKNYKVALLSNSSSAMMDDFFSPAERLQLFDAVVLSGDTNVAKPDRAIFQLTCDRLGVKLSETLMIDDIPTTCDACKTYGMQSICYQNYDQFQTDLADSLQ